jgi:hypothetical protein
MNFEAFKLTIQLLRGNVVEFKKFGLPENQKTILLQLPLNLFTPFNLYFNKNGDVCVRHKSKRRKNKTYTFQHVIDLMKEK